jgi:hypothetical protein
MKKQKHHGNKSGGKIDVQEIGMLAACIADTVIEPLYEYGRAAGFGYIGTLDLISSWAIEFYRQYNNKMKDWETFEGSPDNIFHAICWDDFVISWAQEKVKALG